MEWQPIETALEGRQILGFGRMNGEINGDFGSCVAVIEKEFGSWDVVWTDAYCVTMEPTHWMPLPEPPK